MKTIPSSIYKRCLGIRKWIESQAENSIEIERVIKACICLPEPDIISLIDPFYNASIKFIKSNGSGESHPNNNYAINEPMIVSRGSKIKGLQTVPEKHREHKHIPIDPDNLRYIFQRYGDVIHQENINNKDIEYRYISNTNPKHKKEIELKEKNRARDICGNGSTPSVSETAITVIMERVLKRIQQWVMNDRPDNIKFSQNTTFYKKSAPSGMGLNLFGYNLKGKNGQCLTEQTVINRFFIKDTFKESSADNQPTKDANIIKDKAVVPCINQVPDSCYSTSSRLIEKHTIPQDIVHSNPAVTKEHNKNIFLEQSVIVPLERIVERLIDIETKLTEAGRSYSIVKESEDTKHVTWLDDSNLAESLRRILRRQARRKGINLT